MATRRRVTVSPPPRRPPEDRERQRTPFWADRERRRALLLSLLVHGGVFLVTARLYALPPRTVPEPSEQVIVLELTPLETGAPEVDAAAVEAPAPQGDVVQSAGNAPRDAAPPAPAPSPPRAEPVPTPAPDPVPNLAAAPPSESLPVARTPGGGTLPDLPLSAPASTLPDIEPVEVPPQPLQEAVALPTPEPEAAVTPERRVAVTPQVSVAPSEAVPTPEVEAEIVTREVALPQVEAAVAAEGAIPSPAVGAAVVQAEAVPQPDVQTEVAEAVPQPQAGASVAQAQAVPQPQAGAVVSAAQSVPQPAVSGSAGAAGALPTPQVGAAVAAARPLAVTPGAAVGAAVPITVPGVSATVAPSAIGEAADAGNGPRSAQTTSDSAATVDGQGAASDGSGAASVGIASLEPYAATLERPLAVLIDNADAAYPQQGLVEASSVLEFPVEGGLTRLMSVYTRADPVQVGPIRSARDYFLEAALAMNGTLVHVGGAPSTVGRIASQDLSTLDALAEPELFAEAPDRAAPHRTFSTGTALRDAVGRLPIPVSGTLYTPPSTAPDAAAVTVGYSADYSSGFRYVQELDQYLWQRSGTDASDTAGTAVAADAVVVASVVAFPYPDDPAGRLYLPYTGGAATLYLRGKAVPGSWTSADGFTFIGANGVVVDLTPYKSWVMFAPEGTQVSTQ